MLVDILVQNIYFVNGHITFVNIIVTRLQTSTAASFMDIENKHCLRIIIIATKEKEHSYKLR